MKSVQIVDRNGVHVNVGSNIRVERCVGRYGQVDHVEGTVEQFTDFAGAVLRLLQPARRKMRDHHVWAKPGEQMFVSLPGKVEGDRLVCFDRFEDFEHGHETWIEVIQ